MKNVLVSLAVAAALLLLLAANFTASESRAIRDYQAPVDQVYTAALKAIELQGHSVRDQTTESYATGRGPGSAYRMDLRLRVGPFGTYGARMAVFGDKDHTTVVATPGGFPANFAYTFGNGHGEVKKIFGRLDAEMCATYKTRCPPQALP